MQLTRQEPGSTAPTLSAPMEAPAENPDASEGVVAVESGAGGDVLGGAWPDAAMESAFLAEARSRGESVPVKAPEIDLVDEGETKPLPPLNDLVNRIPADVREALEDLFRARFVTVKRVPKRALKS